MILPRSLVRRLVSARTWITLGVMAPVGMLVLSAMMLLDLRHDAWDKAEQTSRNLLQVIERDIARNIEIIDLSLRGVLDNLNAPGVAEADPELRQLILFDRASTARDMGVMLVLDENGDSIVDANAVPPRRVNNADRAYFQAHKARADLGLYVSKPLVSRLTGARMIVLSRRIDKADGSFGGIVLGTLKLSYFSSLFDRLGLGRDGAINLYHHDGTRIMRHPYVEADIGVSLAGASTFERFLGDGTGTFTAVSVRDGVERHYAFTQVGTWPLILNVALATSEIEAEWRQKALVIGLAVLALCGLTIGLLFLFARELRRRVAMQAEFARLSLTDALTGLPNRRRFEEAIAQVSAEARTSAAPTALLVVDADHFKRYNDRYGHQVGDEILRGIARCLSASVHRPGDIVCRIGGEEFALLLADTDLGGALRVAATIHEVVAALALADPGIAAGTVTVSIGLAIAPGGAPGPAADLYRMADAALYAAKANGRNRTEWAGSAGRPGARDASSDPPRRGPEERHPVPGRSPGWAEGPVDGSADHGRRICFPAWATSCEKARAAAEAWTRLGYGIGECATSWP